MINFLKNLIKLLLAKFISIKTNSKIKSGVSLNFNTLLEGSNSINKKVSISNSKIGYGTYIGENSTLPNTSIGKYCSISWNVNLIAGNHPTKNFVSTHPAFFSTNKQAGFTYVDESLFEETKYADQKNGYSVTIGNDVWIGAHVKILEGVNIASGSVIATGAVVTKNVEPYAIYGGVPAKKIGERFSENDRNFLLKIQWWDMENDWIKQNAYLFSDFKKFKNYFHMNN